MTEPKTFLDMQAALRAERTRTETLDGQIQTILVLAALADTSCERSVFNEWCGACPSCDFARYLTKLNDERVALAASVEETP